MDKLDYCLCKAELDLEFSCKCGNNNVVCKFLNFGIANNHLKYFSTSKQSQSNLLREDLLPKNVQNESERVNLSYKLNLIDFVYVSTLSFLINYKILKLKGLVQQEKLYKLVHENRTENDLCMNYHPMS